VVGVRTAGTSREEQRGGQVRNRQDTGDTGKAPRQGQITAYGLLQLGLIVDF